MGLAILLAIVGLPLLAAAVSAVLPARTALRASTGIALLLVALATVAVVDAELTVLPGRSLVMSPIAQFGIQLLVLAMLGFVMALTDRSDEIIAHWLSVAWLSVFGLVSALFMSALPLALLGFVAAAMLWIFGLPPESRAASGGAALRYAALLALSMPLLLMAYRLAEQRTVQTPDLERIVLALAVPGFGLLLGLIPLHAWTITVASGAPRELLLGVTSLVQTAGFILLLRTFDEHPWLTANADAPLILGGALSTLIGGWLAVSARRADPDDWLVYALVANSGMLMVGLGTQSRAAGVGVALMLFARVLALVAFAIVPRTPWRIGRLGKAAATLALAGTPGVAGFPGLWLILDALRETGQVGVRRLPGADVAHLALIAGSGLLFATALRRWNQREVGWMTGAGEGIRSVADEPVRAGGSSRRRGRTEDPHPGGPTGPMPSPASQGAARAMVLLVGLLILIGVAPQLVAPAFERALDRMFFLFD